MSLAGMTGSKPCRTCETLGMHTPATRILPSGGGRCEEHYRKEAGLPPLRSNSGKEIHSALPAVKIGAEARAAAAAAERENTVKNEEDGRATKLDVAAMQADRDTGMTGAEVAKKYKCSQATVWAHTKKKGNGIPGARPRPTIAERAAAAPVLGGGYERKARPSAKTQSERAGRGL